MPFSTAVCVCGCVFRSTAYETVHGLHTRMSYIFVPVFRMLRCMRWASGAKMKRQQSRAKLVQNGGQPTHSQKAKLKNFFIFFFCIIKSTSNCIDSIEVNLALLLLFRFNYVEKKKTIQKATMVRNEFDARVANVYHSLLLDVSHLVQRRTLAFYSSIASITRI